MRLWNVRARQFLRQPFIGHNGFVHSVSCFLDGRCIIYSPDNKTVRLWEIKIGQKIGIPIKFEDSVEHVSVSNDNRNAVSVFHNGSVSISGMRSRTVFQKFSFDAKRLRNSHISVCFAKNLLDCAGEQQTCIYSLGQQITTMRQQSLNDNLTAVSVVTRTDLLIIAMYALKFESFYI